MPTAPQATRTPPIDPKPQLGPTQSQANIQVPMEVMPGNSPILVHGFVSAALPRGLELADLIKEGKLKLVPEPEYSGKTGKGFIWADKAGVREMTKEYELLPFNPRHPEIKEGRWLYKPEYTDRYLLDFNAHNVLGYNIPITGMSTGKDGVIELHVPAAKAMAMADAVALKYHGVKATGNGNDCEMIHVQYWPEEEKSLSASAVRAQSDIRQNFIDNGLNKTMLKDLNLVSQLETVHERFLRTVPGLDTHVMEVNNHGVEFIGLPGKFRLHGQNQEVPGTAQRHFVVRLAEVRPHEDVNYSPHAFPASLSLAIDKNNHLTEEAREELKTYLEKEMAPPLKELVKQKAQEAQAVAALQPEPGQLLSPFTPRPRTPPITNPARGLVPRP